MSELEKELDSLLGDVVSEEEKPKEEQKPAKPELKEEPKEEVVEVGEEVVEEPPVEQKPKKRGRKQKKQEQPKVEEVKIELDEVVEEPKIVEEFNFDEEETPPAKEVFLIFGDKGTGKTTLALSFPGTIAVLSFDRKSAIIKATRYNNDSRIHVYDVIKYMDYSSTTAVCKSAEYTFEYINKLLDYLSKKIKPDWVVIDGAEIFQQICEWTMRARNNLEAFQGISNLNLWKERRLYIRQIHNKALNVANKGLIYTTYVTYSEKIVQGDVVNKKEVPKWIDVLIFETDYVLYTFIDDLNNRFRVKVITSKNDEKLPTGKEYDITGTTLWEVVGK